MEVGGLAGLLLAAVILVFLVTVILRNMKKELRVFLNATEFQRVMLMDKIMQTHNTFLFRFQLPPNHRLGLPVGQHISFCATDKEGAEVYRSYTPVTGDDQLGRVDFIIKLYPEGKMSQALSALAIGDHMLMRGPKGMFKYATNSKRAIGMLAGGSGITPMYQVLKAILKDKKDTTQVSLIYGNVTEEDIILRAELDGLAARFPGRFNVYHVLNVPSSGWQGGSGFITQDIIKAHLPPPAADVLVLRCGPPPMNKAMETALDALGYTKEMLFQF